jgi:hypothetical protein
MGISGNGPPTDKVNPLWDSLGQIPLKRLAPAHQVFQGQYLSISVQNLELRKLHRLIENQPHLRRRFLEHRSIFRESGEQAGMGESGRDPSRPQREAEDPSPNPGKNPSRARHPAQQAA